MIKLYSVFVFTAFWDDDHDSGDLYMIVCSRCLLSAGNHSVHLRIDSLRLILPCNLYDYSLLYALSGLEAKSSVNTASLQGPRVGGSPSPMLAKKKKEQVRLKPRSRLWNTVDHSIIVIIIVTISLGRREETDLASSPT